jgi:two-component system chemotaxis response regulator CheY
MTPIILCVDDQREVLSAVVKDLESFEDFCDVMQAESADEAKEVIEEADQSGAPVALVICDHIMPGQNGVAFLTELNADVRFKKTRKILLTGLASHQDTIDAINQACVDSYIEKPWKSDELEAHVKKMLTLFLLASGIDTQPFLPVLDQTILYEKLRETT